jgi:hypothetical protein
MVDDARVKDLPIEQQVNDGEGSVADQPRDRVIIEDRTARRNFEASTSTLPAESLHIYVRVEPGMPEG